MRKTKYQVEIFDLDGTILDTLEDLTISINAALKETGLPQHTKEEVLYFVGNGIPKAIERAILPIEDPDIHAQVLSRFTAHYKEHCMDHTFPYPGIPELLAQQKEAGAWLAVVSNKADYAVQDLVRLRFPGVFDAVVGIGEGVARKPAPDAANKALRILAEKTGCPLQTLKAQAVFIGDSDVDIQTARNVGVEEILVSWGFRGRAFLAQHGAKQIVDATEELSALLLTDTEI